MNPENGIKTWQWVVTAIVIIVLIIIGFLVFGNKKSETPTTGDNNTPANDQTGTINRIVMSDQYPGNVVNLSSVQLAQPGFVVIHKDSNGTPGAVIGSTYFDAGINPGKVTLTQPTTDGSTYYAVLYTDTNGDKKFEQGTDQPLKDANGSVIMKVFHASASAGNELKG